MVRDETALALKEYLSLGWKVIECREGTQTPTHKGWNLPGNQITDVSEITSNSLALCHAYSGTMAIDVDNRDLTEEYFAEHGMCLGDLFEDESRVEIRSGRKNRAKLLFRLPEGIEPLPSKVFTIKVEGVRQVAFELNCATSRGTSAKDMLPPSIHPKTGKPYEWFGDCKKLPELPKHILNFWLSQINRDTSTVVPDGDGRVANWDDVDRALEYIDPDCSRDEWLRVGMALHWIGLKTGRTEQAHHMWDRWSSFGQKYAGPHDINTCWHSFKKNGGVTLGTLFKMAYDYGMPYIQQTPEEMFGPILDAEKIDPLTSLIKDTAAPRPDFDTSMLPSRLATYADEIAVSVGCDPLVPTYAALAAVSGVLDARSRLELAPGWKVPPVLWLMTIGDPADKKTPGSKDAFTPIIEIERMDEPLFHQRSMEYQGRRKKYDADYKNYMDYYADPHNALNDYNDSPPIPEIEPEPVPLRILVQDTTSQKLVRTAASRPEGLLCWLDEMSGWINKMCDPRSGEDRSAWVVAYESNRYVMDRVVNGDTKAENFAVSIYGNLQPLVFQRFAGNMVSDGLLQRFIPAILRPEMTRLNQPIMDLFSVKPDWNNFIKRVNDIGRRDYALSDGAAKSFREFQKWYIRAKNDQRLVGANTSFMTAFGKMEGQVGRLALVFQIIEDSSITVVSEEVMNLAINFVKSYVIPALRHLFIDLNDEGMSDFEDWMVQHILVISGDSSEGGYAEVSLRELKRSSRRQVKSGINARDHDNMIIEFMDLMSRYKWVALKDMDVRRNQYVWAVNPKLATILREKRLAVIAARQRLLNDTLNGIREAGHSVPDRKVLGYDGLEENADFWK